MTKGPGRGRGMLQLETWRPCRRPGQARDPSIKPVPIEELIGTARRQATSEKKSAAKTQQNGESPQGAPAPPSSSDGKPVKLVAKYNYASNPGRPGGFDEMSLSAGERLEFVAQHPVNPYWWEAKKDESGVIAFVPASYVMVLETKLDSLPWLEDMKAAKAKQKATMEQEERSSPFGKVPAGVFKPYVSAYGTSSDKSAQPAGKYYCEICDKTLNGPKPYQAHMASKAHKDEVEVASYR